MTFSSLSSEENSRDFWSSYLNWSSTIERLPEDPQIGLLADFRNPSTGSSVFPVLDKALNSLEEGCFPETQIYPPVKDILQLEFEPILDNLPDTIQARYGIPVLNENRVELPLRLIMAGEYRSGYVYFIRLDGEWYIDQWSVDLSGL